MSIKSQPLQISQSPLFPPPQPPQSSPQTPQQPSSQPRQQLSPQPPQQPSPQPLQEPEPQREPELQLLPAPSSGPPAPLRLPSPPPDGDELRRRLEKLCRHYDVDTMKVFMVVEALGEDRLHAVYSGHRKTRWDAFLRRQEACRLDLVRHEKTRDRYHTFLNEVAREEQGRQWFQAVMRTMTALGAADVFNYIGNHAHKPVGISTNNKYNNRSPRRHEALRYPNTYRPRDNNHRHSFHHHPQHHNNKELALLAPEASATTFCQQLLKLFEKKLEVWFDAFHAIAVRLTAHVKVSGLVRVLTGQVHAICTRQDRLHAVLVKVTAQDTPRPLDVAELCLSKVMMIQNGLVLPEDLGLSLLTLHVHPARPVLRLWTLTPSVQMETAIRLADIDDMIDAGRLSQYHELWVDNTTTDHDTVMS